MIVRDLFRYQGDNGVVDTLVELPMISLPMKRIEAEAGTMLTDGEIVVKMLDIPAADLDKWYEIEAPEVEPETDVATEEDYIAALNELGVVTNEED